MPITVGQIDIDGFTMGTGTEYAINRSTLFLAPDVVSDDQQSASDGEHPGADRWGGRQIITEIMIPGDDAEDLHDAITDIKAAWGRRTSGLSVLKFNVENVEKQIYGRGRGADVTLPGGAAVAECRFKQLGLPLTYSVGTDTQTIAHATTEEIPNVGNAEAPFTISIPGPCTVPRVRRDDNDTHYVYALLGHTIPNGQTLVINTRTRTAIQNGVDYWPQLTDMTGRPSPWWGIPAGGEGVKWAATTGTPTATLTYFDGVWGG